MAEPERLVYTCIFPEQSQRMPVFSFAATVEDIQKFAKIDRVSRDNKGMLVGFQRPQIVSHIREIRDYLETSDAILPNTIVVAFTSGIEVEKITGGTGKISIDITDGPPGYIVDGQQRFMALSGLAGSKKFEVLTSAFLCEDVKELQRQFILINNTRPLPKALIYELLPTVNGLPDRMSSRAIAAELVELLNYCEDSSLKGMIYQQTNPYGVIRDTAMQKVIMNSLSDGALRPMSTEQDFKERAFRLLSNFFQAVQNVFASEWKGHTPKTSRLVHGAGIVSMGYVMETLHAMLGGDQVGTFQTGLQGLKGKTAWTEGVWYFRQDDQRKWNSIQNVPRDIRQLAQYLVSSLKCQRLNNASQH